MKLADLVRETTTTEGTGALTLAGAVTGYRSFADAVGDGAFVPVAIEHENFGQYEVVWCTVNAGSPDTLTRHSDRVIVSSNGDAIVNLVAGTKQVRLVEAAPLAAGAAQLKLAARVATTAAITLATALQPGETIDTVTLAEGDLVLVKDQAYGSENGLYVVPASGDPPRHVSLPEGYGAAGAVVLVREGTTAGNEGRLFLCSNAPGSDVVGTDNLSFLGLTTGLTQNVDVVTDVSEDGSGTLVVTTTELQFVHGLLKAVV